MNGGTKTLSGISWEYTASNYCQFITSSQTQQYNALGGTAYQLGSKKNPQTDGWYIQTNEFSATIKSVKVNAAVANGGTTYISVHVGSSQFGSTQTVNNTALNDFTFTGSASGMLKITMVASELAMYIHSIEVTYETGSTPQAEYNIYRTISAQNPNDQGGWLGDWTNCSYVGDYNTNPTGYEVKALSGEEVTFTAGPNSGYEILPENVSIKDANNNNVEVTPVPNENNKFKFIMPASDVTISAYFTFYRPTLRMAGRFNGRSGWVTGNSGPVFTYTYKDENNTVVDRYTLDVYFSGNDNYFFFRADDGNLMAANGNETNYGLNEDNLNGTHSLGGGRNFQIIPGLYTFTINGDRTQLSITRITPTITFNPAAGTVEQGTQVSATSTLTSIINAIKAADPGLEGVDPGAQGTVSVQVSTDNNEFFNAVTLNESATVTGKASIGNIVVTATANYTVAEFYDITCAVVTDAGAPNYNDNSITADKAKAPEGEWVTLTVKAKSGYDFASVKVNGNAITATNGVYKFQMPGQDAEVIAYYTSKTLNITVNNDEAKGAVSGVPPTSTVGSPITFTAAPHTGYTINSVTYTFTPTGGNSKTTTLTAGENNTYTFNMPGYDVTIDVTYDEIVLGQIDPLFHETFGVNDSSDDKARPWNDSYSVKSGVEAVYSGITNYTVSNAKQSRTSTGYEGAGLMASNSDVEASIIMGPLNVADYQSLQLTYQWKPGSTGKTYYTHAYYATSANGTYTDLGNGTGPSAGGGGSYVERTYNLPAAAEVSTLYLKITFLTSNVQPFIDEVKLRGTPKRTKLAQIEEEHSEAQTAGTFTIADDLQVVAISAVNDHQVAFARDFAESIDPATCPQDAVDFMRNMVYTEADKQVGEWQQNNWVMLDFTDVPSNKFGALTENCVIKGGTLKGNYSDYTIEVSNDFEYVAGTAVGNYTPNVYSPANFYLKNNVPTYIQEYDGVNYWFMTPKPMEVCKFTWAMYYNDPDNDYPEGFYMQDGDVTLKGGVGIDLSYNNVAGASPENGASYRFTGVIMPVKQGKKDNPENHHPQDGSTLNPNFKVAATDLDTSEDSDQIITAVSEVKTGGDVVSVTYCDLAGRMSQKPFAGVNIIVTRYSDGTVKTTKAIK